ncbi:hypothetical protein [Flavisolibacter ginsenosidimutans]|uniref:Cytochrome c domain-containing protein n=1 Tax=Flavisolibacter ginsenosidimutans TaxID=661481 RepID=A0A5B8UG56_9BACT|nr:hypothetical protein [Flavisolibacter ginsenosidimutans]QEC55119.1 hypothetical protein FSB75_04090 [Flavisolibacter ginsenosidimutans]
MKKNFFLPALIISAAFFFTSCSKSNGETNNGTVNDSGTPGPLFSAVKTMMSSNCAVSGCHVGAGAASGLDFSNSNTIVAQQARIKVRAVDQAGTVNQMPQPPNAPLTAADQKKIIDWITAGGRLAD